MADEREPLPPGVLPNIFDTDPPPLNPATVIGNGFTGCVPVCEDVPFISQSSSLLSCTMGNWDGEPTSYAYQWLLDGTAAGDNAPTYDASGDVGKDAVCVVGASNAYGLT